MKSEHIKIPTPLTPNASTRSTYARSLKSLLTTTHSNGFVLSPLPPQKKEPRKNRTDTKVDKNSLCVLPDHVSIPSLMNSSHLKMSIMSSHNSSEFTDKKKSRHKIMTEEQQEKLMIKSDWRELSKYQMFEDYLRIRDANGLKQLKLPQNEETKEDEKKKQLVFSSPEQEKEYQEEQRRKQLDRAKEHLTLFGNRKLSFLVADESVLNMKKELRLLHECLKILEKIKRQITVAQMDEIQPLCDDLINIFSNFGVVNFYLLALFGYGRQRFSYANWKKYLRVCNLQGAAHHKYKLIGYKHISKCCMEIGKSEKALIYLKKMLKLAWVIDDRSYELLSYDMISVLSFYNRDLKNASFFHNKFVNGDYEDKSSVVRQLGEQNYLMSQQLKEHVLDKNSFSEDDFDLDTIIQKCNLDQWVKEQKERERLKDAKIAKVRLRSKGMTFPKFDDINLKESYQQSKIKITKFTNKWAEELGPVYKKPDNDVDLTEQIISKIKNRALQIDGANTPVLFNHKSPLRGMQQYLSQREQAQPKPAQDDHADEVIYRPNEQMRVIKKLINVFQFDLRYFTKNSYLYSDTNEL